MPEAQPPDGPVDDREPFASRPIAAPIEPPSLLVVRHDCPPDFTLTITLAPEGEGTRVRWRHRFANAEDCAAVASYAKDANVQNLGWLAAVVAERS